MLVRRLLLTLLVLGCTGALAGLGTFGAWSAPTTSAGNGFATGSVILDDNDVNTQMFNVGALKPTSPVADRQRCIKLTYSGSLAANVTLHGATTGSLTPYLNLRVERGTDAGTTFPTCSAGFSATSVVYDGPLSSFNTSASPIAHGAAWAQGEVRVYRFTLTLANDPAAQGLSSGASFTWTATNT